VEFELVLAGLKRRGGVSDMRADALGVLHVRVFGPVTYRFAVEDWVRHKGFGSDVGEVMERL
jgi:hypothetical protein